ncbi:CpsD/CapB family tyrosine-protein kinase [Listeria grandensis]|uniref:Capsular polysaccharide biosynthesis n=2 Tax=Listeria grandensis TaxID=1494963 RepID=W7BQX7_9LIST|nr:CpsD/CapB family tyrosine-protein kinase [Listeria grandensis]EUJ22628.1 capsular polysaccharide biosynthesis [Listeria grandensis FSL F6-0971]MBC1473827.1 CpsD/CapB family tyrosine-protein kinase [Listeria grandensis]MBC1936156.1 CpsD/CapB family tyrosine-protein kinase [Listeria grandensis]
MFTKRRVAETIITTGNEMTMQKNSVAYEKFSSIQTNIQFMEKRGGRIQTIAVTSANKGEGKSFFITNYANTSALYKQKTLLIDVDFYNPKITKQFKTKLMPGLSNILVDMVTFEEAIIPLENKYLSFLPIGTLPPNPLELLRSEEFKQLLEDLKEEFDLILLDCPPVNLFTDARVVAAESDGAILLINSLATTEQDVLKSKELLEQVDANILGAVLNNKRYNNKQLASYNYY